MPAVGISDCQDERVRKQVIILCLKYGVGLGLLAWVVASNWHVEVNGREVGLSAIHERTFHPAFYVLALLVALSSVLMTFVRWYVLVRAQEMPFTLHSALRLGMIGYYFSTFLPGAVGGDLIKAACIAREQSRRTVAVATVLVDRVVGLTGLVWLTALVGGLFWSLDLIPSLAADPNAVPLIEGIIVTAGALMGGSLVFWLLLGLFSPDASERWAGRLARIPKVGPPLAELWRAVRIYRARGRSVGLALGMAMVGHVGFLFVFYCASRSINPPERIPSFAGHLLITPVGNTIQAGIPTPGGVGGGEIAFEKLYGVLQGETHGEGVLASLTARTVTWVLAFVGYLVYLRMKAASSQPGAAGYVLNEIRPAQPFTSGRSP